MLVVLMLHVRFLLSTPASSVQSLQSEKRSREKTLRARRDRINPEGYQEQDASEQPVASLAASRNSAVPLSLTKKATPQSPASHGVSSSSVPASVHFGCLLVQMVLTQEGTPSDMRKAKDGLGTAGERAAKNPQAPRMSDVKQQPQCFSGTGTSQRL